jgi:PAS domain-containing protein
MVSGVVGEVAEAMIVTDPDLRVLGWNPAAERLYGWSEQEVLGPHPRSRRARRHGIPRRNSVVATQRPLEAHCDSAPATARRRVRSSSTSTSMWMAWFKLRLPRGFNRCRSRFALDASIGAVPL